MSKQKKNKQSNQLSPENYIRKRARNLPVYKCYISEKWEKARESMIVIVRKHASGNVTFGLYMVDLMCLGVRVSLYDYNILEEEFQEMLKNFEKEAFKFKEIPYTLAHNIIYAAIEYAEEYGFHPVSSFTRVTQYLLEEDNEAIPYIEIRCGDENGNPVYINTEYETQSEKNKILKNLETFAGPDNYTYIDSSEDSDDYDEDDYDKDDYEAAEEEYKQLKDELQDLDNEELKTRFTDALAEVGKTTDFMATVKQLTTIRALTDVILETVITIDENKIVKYFKTLQTYFKTEIINMFDTPNALFQGVQRCSSERLSEIYEEFLDKCYDETEQALEEIQKELGDIPFVKYLELKYSDYSIEEYDEKLNECFKKHPKYLMFKILYYAKSSDSFKRFKTLLQHADEAVTIFEFCEFVNQYVRGYMYRDDYDIEELIAYEIFTKIIESENISIIHADTIIALAKIDKVKKYYGIADF